MKTITRFCATRFCTNKLTTILMLLVSLFSFSLFNLFNSTTTNALTVTASPSGSGAGALSFNLTPGIFSKVSQTITVDNTNYRAGYTMTLETIGLPLPQPVIRTNDLVNRTLPYDTTKRIPTLSSTITSPNDFNNNWGYSFFNTNVAADDPLRNTFYPVPGFDTTDPSNPTPIQNTLVSTTTSSTTPDEYELSFGAKVDTNIPAGTYANIIIVRVVSNPTTCSGGNICYDDNGANSNTTMGNQTISSSATDATLWPSNYQYNGGNYGFAGWNTKADGTGTSYGPNQTITDTTTLNDIKTNGLVLYAIWKKGQGYLQSWTPASCAAMNIGDTTALTDNRDGNTYAIAKLADGKCWMIESLRLSNTHTTTGQPVTINSTNTNNPASGFALNAPQDPTSSSWCTDENAACINQSRHATNNTQNPAPNMTNPNSNVYSYGNYYNWYTATAGNGTYSTSGSTNGDICPAGWHLPKGGTAASGGEFAALDIAMGGTGDSQSTAEASNRWRTFPNNFVYPGYLRGYSVYDRGSYGNYWSATADGSSTAYNPTAYNLFFYSSYVNPSAYDGDKFNGRAVRCLLSTTYTINFDSNGGSGTMNPQTATVGQATNLSANTFTRDGFTFNGWNTEANGSGTSYTDEQEVTDLAQAGGSITLYAQWVSSSSCSANKICYDDNNANSHTTMGDQSISSSATDATLWPSNYQYNGGSYGFAGWNTKADGTGTSYGPNQTITDSTVINNIKANGLTLYAMWVQSTGYMQNFTASQCSTMNIGDITALADRRPISGSRAEYETYAVAKLADGKCWMIENLRLSLPLGENPRGDPVEIDSDNTNYPASGVLIRLPQDPISDPWCEQNTAACIDQTLHATNNTTNTVPTMTNPYSNVYSYGNYYNWYTATAGNGTYSMASGNTAGDICPKGWHVPTGTSSGEYKALNDALGGNTSTTGSNTLRSYPNNFVYSGYVLGSSLFNRSSYGYYWSSTASSSSSAYHLAFNSSSVSPGTNLGYKYYGFSVRCVLGS